VSTIVVIVIVVIVVAAVIAAVSLAVRRRRLQQRFGPEYDRVVETSDSRLQAEAELAGREKRVRNLDIRPLDPSARASHQAQWTTIQQQFVDQPADAVSGAQQLITAVMADRGYPTEDVDQVVADLSVDHAATLGHFRTAQDIAGRVSDGTASTEDLRQAMIHYRLLFQELLDDQAVSPELPVTEAPVAEAPVTEAPVAEPGEPAVTEASNVTQPDVNTPDPAWDEANAEPAARLPWRR
jgi:hypothetical protein